MEDINLQKTYQYTQETSELESTWTGSSPEFLDKIFHSAPPTPSKNHQQHHLQSRRYTRLVNRRMHRFDSQERTHEHCKELPTNYVPPDLLQTAYPILYRFILRTRHKKMIYFH